jgi:hypothetical protein
MEHVMQSRLSLALIAAIMTLPPLWSARADQLLDPDQLPARDRNYALHGALGSTDPWRHPANPGCSWSRVQVPTSQGLKWMASEECTLEFER